MTRKGREYTTESTGWLTVIGLDPGGTTGWAVMSVEPDALTDPDISILKSIAHYASGEAGGPTVAEDRNITEVLDLLAMWPDAAVVIESFQLRKFTMGKELLAPVRIRAVVDYVCNVGIAGVGRARPTWTQSPSMAMSTATDERLKQWGLYRPGSDHAKDATRHAITFLRRAKERQQIRERAWPSYFTAASA